MFGDFSRDSFDPSKHYTRVLMQQGRPLTDADWNEQVTSLIETQRQLAIALIGWHGTSDGGFRIIKPPQSDYCLSRGSYIVDGIQVANGGKSNSADACPTPMKLPASFMKSDKCCVYLDIWEQSICPAQDDSILEPAISPIDTAWRTRLHWAVKHLDAPIKESFTYRSFINAVCDLTEKPPATLEVRRSDSDSDARRSECRADLKGSINGQSDRLYRVEINRSGDPMSLTANADGSTFATFKWSRDNGSVVAALSSGRDGNNATIPPSGSRLPRDVSGFASPMPIAAQKWCELVDKEGRSVNKNRQLIRTKNFNSTHIEVTASVNVEYPPLPVLAASYSLGGSEAYFLRQWDHSGTALVKDEVVSQRVEGAPASTFIRRPILADDGCLAVVGDVWIELDDGIAFKFSGVHFREGDHWLIRTSRDGVPKVLPGPDPGMPRAARTSHHYAPIGTIQFIDSSIVLTADYWEEFTPKGAKYNTATPTKLGLPTPSESFPIRPVTPTPVPVDGAAAPATPVSMLSSDGIKAVKAYFATPQDLTRRVFARHLNHKHEPKSPRYQKYRSALLLSEILETSFENYFAKVDRCLSLSDSEKATAEEDARADYALAVEFERTLLSGDSPRSRLA